MKREPNEIYLATHKELENIVCIKLEEEVNGCESIGEKLFNHMCRGLKNKRIFSFVSYGENGEMNGYSVLVTRRDPFSGLVLHGFFTWTNEHYPKLWKEYMEFTENFAKEFKIKNYHLFRVILQGGRLWNRVIRYWNKCLRKIWFN